MLYCNFIFINYSHPYILIEATFPRSQQKCIIHESFHHPKSCAWPKSQLSTSKYIIHNNKDACGMWLTAVGKCSELMGGGQGLRGHDVQPCSANLVGLQRLDQCLLVDHTWEVVSLEPAYNHFKPYFCLPQWKLNLYLLEKIIAHFFNSPLLFLSIPLLLLGSPTNHFHQHGHFLIPRLLHLVTY